MAYQSDYTGAQADKSHKMNITPDYVSIKTTSGDPMPQTILASNTYQDVVFLNVESRVIGNLTYDGAKITYNGTEDVLMTINIACSVSTSTTNTIVHIGQNINLEPVEVGTESSSKCESATAIQSLNVASDFMLSPGDTINLKIEADKICTVNIYHIQAVLKQSKIEED